MGVNNPNFPNEVKSETSAIQYLGAVVNAQRLGLYNNLTGSPTITAAQMVGGAAAVAGGTTATATTDTAANIITRMGVVAPGATTGSTSSFRLINDNSGVLTLAGGVGVTIVGTDVNKIAAGSNRGYVITITGASTVTLTAM